MKLIIAANTLSQLIGKIIGAGTTFAISILLAQQFGVSGYGDFVKVTTFVAFFFLIADFGLNAIYLQHQKDDTALPTLFALRVIGGFSLIFLALAILSFLPHGQLQGYTDIVRFGIILFSPAILFQSMITTANAVFQKHLRYDLATIALSAGCLITIGMFYLLSRFPLSASIIGPIVLLSGSLTTAFIAWLYTKHMEPSLHISFSTKKMTSMFIASLPLGLTLFFNLVYGHVDSLIITLTRPTTEVGIYGLAYKLFELILVFPTFFMNAVYPMMLKAASDKQQAIMKKSFFFLLLVSFLLSLVTWFAAPLVTHIQEGFAASIPALRVLSLSLPFFFVSALTMWALIALKKQQVLVGIYAGAMIINIFLNVWCIPIFGYMAAAWITLVSEGFVLLVSGCLLLRYIR